jgi:DNA polymerase III alpha subunit
MAYIKARWPAAFFCARLMNWGGFHHPAMYMAEAIRLGASIRPPHVNASGRKFTLDRDGDRPVLWMGLDQVRDLRQSSVRAIVEEREQRAFGNLRDLLQRVPLQRKEVAHLIQCGALDGMGESRAALLAEAGEIERAGSALQMTLFGGETFDREEVVAESLEQRLAWENQLLGYPVSVLGGPLGSVSERLPECIPLRALPECRGRDVQVAAVRLPGWTGGEGFHLWDGETWVVAKAKTLQKPKPWLPMLLRGRCAGDESGTLWLEVREIHPVL